MKRRVRNDVIKLSAIAFVLISIGFAACRSNAPEEAPAPTPVMAVTGARVVAGPIESDERLLGQTVALRHLIVRAPTAGQVIGLTLQTGDKVRRGEIIAHVLSREVEAAEHGLAVAQQLDGTEAANLAVSVRRYSHSSGVAVAAPNDGIVAQRMVSSGQIVADLDPLADLIDPLSVVVNAVVPSANLATLRPGMAARISSPIAPGASYPGRVSAIAPSFESGTETSLARVEFTGAKRLFEANAPVEIVITTASVADAILIPRTALFQSASTNDYYVFVAKADGRAHRTPVQLGLRANGIVQITAGLAPGDVVITSGGYALANGLRVKVTMAAAS